MPQLTRIAPLFPIRSRGVSCLLSRVAEVGQDHGFRITSNYRESMSQLNTEGSRIHADALLLWEGNPDKQRHLARFGKPMLTFSCERAVPAIPSVWPDNLEAGRLAAEHFIELGFTNLAYSGPTTTYYSRLRRQGFESIGKSGNRQFHDLDRCEAAFASQHWPTMRSQIIPVLQELPKPCGIVTVDDQRAVLLQNLLHEAGMRVPDDIALIGINDSDDLVVHADPSLTSVRLPYEAMGERAGQIILQQLQGRQSPMQPSIVSGCQLIVRQSTNTVPVADQELSRTLQFIREEAERRPLTVTDIANSLPVSRKTLDRRMHSFLGRSVAAEIRRVRAGFLTSFLRDTDWAIKRIAEHMGFANADDLSKWCRRHLDQTPSDIRSGRIDEADADQRPQQGTELMEHEQVLITSL